LETPAKGTFASVSTPSTKTFSGELTEEALTSLNSASRFSTTCPVPWSSLLRIATLTSLPLPLP
jgi:hypothetical protein